VLFSAMAEGTSHLSGVLDSEDVRASIRAVEALGAVVSLDRQADGTLAGTVTGWGAEGPSQPDAPIDCGNSGTTARLLMGIVAPWDIKVTITGDESLKKRPMRRIVAPLAKMGVDFVPETPETLPITVCGNRALRAIDYAAPWPRPAEDRRASGRRLRRQHHYGDRAGALAQPYRAHAAGIQRPPRPALAWPP
ncbi:MAG: hypothetical protein ACLSDQ_13280, partial [Adlercreutzia equolifaciens]